MAVIPMSGPDLFPAGHKITDTPEDFIRGIAEIRALVGATMGPYGTNVIPTGQGLHSAVWKDGARVIEGYTPINHIGANAVQRIRDAAQATLRVAGDGTSTTTVFLSTLYLTAMELIIEAEKDKPVVRRLVSDKIVSYLDKMIEALQGMAVKDIGHDVLEKVATLAGANNPVLGKKIADLVAQIGAKGSINPPERSKSGEWETDTIPGYAFDGGLYDPTMLPPSSPQLVLDDPYIVLLYDQITTELDVQNLVADWSKTVFEPSIALDPRAGTIQIKHNCQPLVLISPDIDAMALSMLVAREYSDAKFGRTGMRMPVFCIRPPKDVPLEQFYQDLHALTGGVVLNKKKGSRFDKFKLTSAGQATRLTASMGKTTIIGDAEKGSALEARVTAEMETMDEAAQVVAQDRLSRLRAKVGVIRIPGPTQGSVLWSQEVVDDARRATQAALEHGVLPGCGRALLAAFEASRIAQLDERVVIEEEIAQKAVQSASHSIFRTVMTNAGVIPEVITLFIYHLNKVGVDKTVVVNELMVHQTRAMQAGRTPGEKVFNQIVKNAFESGVLDSALGVIEAVKNSKAEIALWIQTKHWSAL